MTVTIHAQPATLAVALAILLLLYLLTRGRRR